MIEIGRKGRLIVGIAFVLSAVSLLPHAAAGRPEGNQPKDYASWTKRGEALREEEKYAEAEAAFQNALAFPSGDYRAEAALAKMNLEIGKWQQAVEFYRRARRKAPKNYDLCMNLARTYSFMGRLDAAKELYAEARRINPKESIAYIEEGYLDLHSENYAQAKNAFEGVIAIDTSSPYGYHHMGSYFAARHDWPATERYLKKALELYDKQPKSSDPKKHLFDILHTLNNLVVVFRQEGRLDEEEALLRRMMLMASSIPQYKEQTLDLLALLYVREHKPAQAEEYFKQAVALCGPEFLRTQRVYCINPLVHLASLYADDGRAAQAREAVDKAWSLYPAADQLQPIDVLPIQGIGLLYSRLGDDAKAERSYRVILSQRSRVFAPPENFARVEALLGSICGKTGREGEASELYRDAIRIAHLSGEAKEEARFRAQSAVIGIKTRPHPSRSAKDAE